MARRKRNKLAPVGFAVDQKTGKISEVVHITKDTLKQIQDQLNEMHAIIKQVSRYTHSRRLDARIAKHLKSVS